MCQCHVFLFYQVMATFQLQYKKGHMDLFSLHDQLLLPKQFGSWPTLCHCSSQAPAHVGKEQDTNLMTVLGV